ncbi:hypothetical protein GEOBRER4_n0427 [Citrifermentans bremense]|uniref:HD domain-containing protein n=1 Tax=Citrifermentans bremense TaxID=60035 RepID=A0A6S6M240_9BACT|nr:hypothetical protein [Citrifermentans bremense]BCG45664.1 hypothetical protein GEOBRER4_n0427 [Citrifermentans bremense]
MGINRTIFNAINDVLVDYGCSPAEIETFLMARWGLRRRQTEAISILDGTMTYHGKQELLHYVVELARVEHGIRELEPWVRDHVAHALLSFLLGIYINERFMKERGLDVDTFQWKLAGLFHDVAYPAQVARDILKPFTGQINKIKETLRVEAPDVFFKLVPVGLDGLRNDRNSLDLIQQRLDQWGLRVDAAREYNDMLESGQMCHGIMSSLSVLYVIDLMYQKYNPQREHRDIFAPVGINWNQAFFENDVVSACSAIFVHNLPARCFKDAPIDKDRAPLAFLLKLSDCLQDWGRPSAENPRGLPTRGYKIKVTDGRLVFTVADEHRRQKIAEEIQTTLVTSDIEIC